MKMAEPLEPLLNKLIKCVYKDGPNIKVRKGQLLGVDAELLVLRTFEHTYAIKRACIIELKTLEEEPRQ